jgi:hypothetical protein
MTFITESNLYPKIHTGKKWNDTVVFLLWAPIPSSSTLLHFYKREGENNKTIIYTIYTKNSLETKNFFIISCVPYCYI